MRFPRMIAALALVVAKLPTVEELQAEVPGLTDVEDMVETPGGDATPAA